MDYSLLFGVHFCDDIPGDAALSATCTEAESPDGTWMMNGQRPFIRLGGNMPARAEHRVGFSQQNESVRTGVGPRYGGGGISPSPSISLSAIPPQTRIMGGSGEVFNVILYFGIIDILQDYDISKRIEHAYKSWQVDPTSISAVDPNS